ncbi:MAG: hypothetical protein QHH05_02065, partial [Syntrophomonadaceae bacterium]|nr:hypothetical protein [Syntrophomonadaceae bacterium]
MADLQHQGEIVGIGGGFPGGRRQHCHLQRGVQAQSLAGGQRQYRNPAGPQHPHGFREGRPRVGGVGHRHRAHAQFACHRSQSPDVVDIGVADQHQVQGADALAPQRWHQHVVPHVPQQAAPGIDEQGASARRPDQRGIPLPHVQEPHLQAAPLPPLPGGQGNQQEEGQQAQAGAAQSACAAGQPHGCHYQPGVPGG